MLVTYEGKMTTLQHGGLYHLAFPVVDTKIKGLTYLKQIIHLSLFPPSTFSTEVDHSDG